MSNMNIIFFYGTELNCPQHTVKYTFTGEYFRHSWKKKNTDVLVYIPFFFSFNLFMLFDSKYPPFIFLYIFLLSVFIVIHQNTCSNYEKKKKKNYTCNTHMQLSSRLVGLLHTFVQYWAVTSHVVLLSPTASLTMNWENTEKVRTRSWITKSLTLNLNHRESPAFN